MKIIYKYLIKQVSEVFGICLIVFTFVIFIGNMLRIMEMMSKGVGIFVVFRFLVLLVPFMLSYSIPISILTSVLLVFARLSADNEITAIRSSGINLKFVIKPVILYALVLVLTCYIINDKLRPNAIFKGRKLLLEIGMQEPIINITSGRFNEVFPNYVLYVGQRHGKNLNRVVLYKFEDNKLNSVITSETGEVIHGDKDQTIKVFGKDKEDRVLKKGNIYLYLNNGVIEEVPKDEQGTGKINRMQFETYMIEFDLNKQVKDVINLVKKEREMTNKELAKRVNDMNNSLLKSDYNQLSEKLEQEISSIKTRIHNRLAMSLSCLAFVLIGIPLGIRVHRSETSIGAGISLILVSAYYFTMTLGEAFQYRYSYHPWLLMWGPNVIMLIIGIILTYRLLQK